MRGAPELVADYYNRGTAAEPMPDELKSLLSIQEASPSAQLFPTAGVQLHYIHGSRAQPLYPARGRVAYATAAAGQQNSTVSACMQRSDDGSFCLAPTLADHRTPSSVASSSAAGQRVHTDNSVDDGDGLEDDETFARAMQSVKARWNSPA